MPSAHNGEILGSSPSVPTKIYKLVYDNAGTEEVYLKVV